MPHELVIIGMDTDEKSRNILKAELAKRNISYSKLAELLSHRGWKLNKAAIDNRMARGAFIADFFLDSLRVIGCKDIGIIKKDD